MQILPFFLLFFWMAFVNAEGPLQDESNHQPVQVEHRTSDFILRDQYRHPYKTLTFFQVGGEQTVIEIWPGAGWYTEILAPALKSGTFYAAHFPEQSDVAFFNRNRAKFVEKMASSAEIYGDVQVVQFDPKNGILDVPDESADRLLTFRNVHNWLRSDSEQAAFDLFYQALKPGGLLGVVEHHSRNELSKDEMISTGYMTKAYVKLLAANAGFELIASSEVNANPKDTTDHPKGVWTLPPTLRLKEVDRDKYLAVGESNRMTLLFRKNAP